MASEQFGLSRSEETCAAFLARVRRGPRGCPGPAPGHQSCLWSTRGRLWRPLKGRAVLRSVLGADYIPCDATNVRHSDHDYQHHPQSSQGPSAGHVATPHSRMRTGPASGPGFHSSRTRRPRGHPRAPHATRFACGSTATVLQKTKRYPRISRRWSSHVAALLHTTRARGPGIYILVIRVPTLELACPRPGSHAQGQPSASCPQRLRGYHCHPVSHQGWI